MNQQATHRCITYRLVPRTRAKARALSRLAGACRHVWNQMLADQQALYDIARMHGAKPPPVSFFTLGKAFRELHRATPWLGELSYGVVRYTLKRQADAWTRFFKGQGRKPRFKGRCGDDGFTIPDNIRMRSGALHVPKLGWVVLRRRGGNPYPRGEPKQVYVTRRCGKWYATVSYAVETGEPADNGLALGVDCNVGQVAVSTGDILRHPDISRLEARRRRYQRMVARRCKGSNRRARAKALVARTSRRLASVRSNWQHHVSRTLAETAGLVVIEDLRTKAMTASAKGTMQRPGAKVRQKAGLNRSILSTGWRALREQLAYKAAHLVAVDPAYTSQTCHRCGEVDAASRRSQSQFECVRCGHRGNADINAALNILASGTGASGRRGALALATPMSRQMDRGLAALAISPSV